ncbi:MULTISPECIES: helix-turn-helix transcriptional regulator [unclassified Flavobacterium]|jgi:transcriptional regulator with XRE-family HTH domain|uniref:helix-turn-helix domain-containing protein n=1 Tax=unclassified Flavobacterium TaxID=196869 RepID=UPI0032E40733
MILGHKIKKLRELKDLTQEYMAQELGLNQSAYSKIESGASDVSFSKLEKIATVLGLKLEDILSFNEQLVFNVMNNQNGQNGLVINNSVSENEKGLYTGQISSLKEEVAHLKKILDQVLTAK